MRFLKMYFRLWESFKDPGRRARLSWLGGGVGAVLVAIWTIFTFGVDHKDVHNEQVAPIQKLLGDQLGQKDAQVAALTTLLLEKNVAAAPSARQAVGAAVGSIAQGAAEGDARLQQALDLLKANNFADATRLLSAVAEDKTARAGQETAPAAKDRKEAAIAYRNLGAIAGLGDPKRALETYEKAIALDPDDLESLVGIGWIQIDYGDLNEAQPRLERVLTLAKTSDQASNKYWALLGLGDIEQQRGDLAGALKSRWKHDLSVAFTRVAEVQKAQGDLAGALKSYSDGRTIIDRLAQSGPGNADWQRDLSASFIKIGDVQMAQGDLAGALKSYSDGVAIRERLAQSGPGNADWQRNLAVSYNKVGDVQMEQGDLAGALKSYQDSLSIRDRLAKSGPGNAEWQRDLAVSFGKLASVSRQSGDNAKALDALRQGQAIMSRMTKLSPDNAAWKKDLAEFDGQIKELAER